jgi:hypothetical protein
MIIGVIGFWILGVVAAALSPVFADEFKAWMPWFTKWLIRRAIGRLPEDQRERYREEWSSDIEETPGDIGKIFKAMGFVQAPIGGRQRWRKSGLASSLLIAT